MIVKESSFFLMNRVYMLLRGSVLETIRKHTPKTVARYSSSIYSKSII